MLTIMLTKTVTITTPPIPHNTYERLFFDVQFHRGHPQTDLYSNCDTLSDQYALLIRLGTQRIILINTKYCLQCNINEDKYKNVNIYRYIHTNIHMYTYKYTHIYM